MWRRRFDQWINRAPEAITGSRRLVTLCLIALAVLLPRPLPAEPNPDYVNALWVAESNGVLKLATDTDTGTVLFELTPAGSGSWRARN